MYFNRNITTLIWKKKGGGNNHNFTMLSEYNWVAECSYIHVATYLSYLMVLKLLNYVKKFWFYRIVCRTMHNAGTYKM